MISVKTIKTLTKVSIFSIVFIILEVVIALTFNFLVYLYNKNIGNFDYQILTTLYILRFVIKIIYSAFFMLFSLFMFYCVKVLDNENGQKILKLSIYGIIASTILTVYLIIWSLIQIYLPNTQELFFAWISFIGIVLIIYFLQKNYIAVKNLDYH